MAQWPSLTIPNIGSWWTLAHLKTSAFCGFSGALMWFMTTGVVLVEAYRHRTPRLPGPMLCKWGYEWKFHQSIGINKSMYVFEVFWSSGQKKKRSLALTFMSMCEHWIHLYRELAWNESEHRDWIETCNLVLDCSLLKLLTILKPHLTLVKLKIACISITYIDLDYIRRTNKIWYRSTMNWICPSKWFGCQLQPGHRKRSFWGQVWNVAEEGVRNVDRWSLTSEQQ